MGPIYSLQDFLDMTRRHIGVIITVCVLGSLIGLFLAWSQQHRYRSSEVMQIEQPIITNELAPSTVDGSSARRLQRIEQQLMARDNLLEIIEQFNLFADRPALTENEKVVLLRQSISINGVAAVREGFSDDGTIAVLTVTAEMDTAALARDVAHEFAERTRSLSRAQRSSQTKETLDFFIAEQVALETQILDLEGQIAAFQSVNDLSISGGVAFRRSEIASINSALIDVDRERVEAELALDQIDRTARQSTVVREETALENRLTSLALQSRVLEERRDALVASLETSPEIERELANFERQMMQLQGQLDVISTRRNEAEVGFKLEETAQGERLITIEAAQLPDYPYTASRKKRAVMSAGASLLLGFVAAFLLDLRRPVIRTAAQMQRETGILPVVSIPMMQAPKAETTLRERLLKWVGASRKPAPQD